MSSEETIKEAERRMKEILYERKKWDKMKYVIRNSNTEILFGGIDMLASHWLGGFINETALDGIDFGNGKLIRNNTHTAIPYDFVTNSFGDDGLYSNIKIDTKASVVCPKYDNGCWHRAYRFNIGKNKVADEFILVGYDNILNVKPQHIWRMRGDEDVGHGLLNNRKTFDIYLGSGIDKYKQWEVNGNIMKELQMNVDKIKKVYYSKLLRMILHTITHPIDKTELEETMNQLTLEDAIC